MLIHKLFDYINSRARVFILSPLASALGDCADEMYYGLVKVQREGKRMLLLRVPELPGRFRLGIANRELLELEAGGYFVDQRGILVRSLSMVLAVVYGVKRLLFIFLQKSCVVLHRTVGWRKMPREERWVLAPFIGRASLWKPYGVDAFRWEVVDEGEWRKAHEEFRPPELNQSQMRLGVEMAAAMGLPRGAWYACLHVREGGFYHDHRCAARNASISNYLEGIRAIVASGGWVVRIGDPTMTRLPPMKQVIDYAHSQFKSPLMDIYLISRCDFFVGTFSGPREVAKLFGKREVLVNLPEWTFFFPMKRGDLAILKHVYSRSRRRFLSVKELAGGSLAWQCCFRTLADDFVMVENTSEEIKELITEFLQKPQSYPYCELQETCNEARKTQLRNHLATFLTEDNLYTLDNTYRIAAGAAGADGALGSGYLEKNWYEDGLVVSEPVLYAR